MQHRRRFLRDLSAAAVAWGLGANTRLWAAPSGGNRLVFVFLRGAYDGLSVLVPHGEPFYYEARPSIAIAKPDAADPLSARPLDARWGLHPVLDDTVGELFRRRELALIPFAGTTYVSRSHFQAQDWIESGKLPEQRPDASDGFLNRLAAQLGRGAGGAISFTQSLPIALRGAIRVANSPLGSARPSGGRMTEGYESLVMAMYKGHGLEPLVSEGLGLRRAITMELAEEMQASSRDAIAASGFAQEAGRLGRYLREHPAVSIAFTDIGGWDTHAGQGGAQGALAGRLSSLGQGLEALTQGLGPTAWSRTAVVVMSEFGRTFRENGSRGTDHGHGNVIWMAGGALRGGAVRGEQAGLDAASLHQGRDIPVMNDHRAVLAGLFARMYGLDSAALGSVFPGAKAQDLGVI